MGAIALAAALWLLLIGSLACKSGPRVFVNIIVDPVPKDTRGAKILDHVRNLTLMYTSHGISAADIVLWPPVFSLPCDPLRWTGGLSKGRGSNIVHKEIWDMYYRKRRPGCNDKVIVHEYDAFLGNTHAIQNSVDMTRNMTHDFLYLGYCYKKAYDHPARSGNAPYCLHAYALTINGTKNLLEVADSCGVFMDVQVAVLANAGGLSWTYAKSDYDRRFVDDYLVTHGVRPLGPFLFGGEFIQAKYDDFLDRFPDGTVAHAKSRPKQLYQLRNQTWYKLHGMGDFAGMNMSHKAIKVLSDWQFRRYPEESK